MRISDWSSDVCSSDLVAQPLLALGDFGRHCIAEILHFVEGPDFKFTRPGHRIGAALGPGDGLVHALDLPDPVAGDQLARLGEGAVDPRALRSEEHTSELQSLMSNWNAVFCLKKKTHIITHY